MTKPAAPIEVLVPRPEPSMSMFANKQDYETARSVEGVQPPAGDDLANLARYRWLRQEADSANGRLALCTWEPGKGEWNWSPICGYCDEWIDRAMKGEPT